MINLPDYLSFVEERRNNFDNQCNALRINRNLTSLAALYMDLLTSNLGEKWDNTLLIRELDDIIEELKEQGVMFRGQAISDRRTDKDDPFVIKFVETVPRMIIVKDEHGNELKDEHGKIVKKQNGYKEVTKRKHIHTETMDIWNARKTNAFGIPTCKLYGEYHPGYYATTTNMYTAFEQNKRPALRVGSPRAKLAEEYANVPVIMKTFFDNISDRCKYGLSAFSEITINNNGYLKPAGLIRIDFDIDAETGAPVATNVALMFNSKAFIAGHVSEHNLIANTMDFIAERLAEAGIAIADDCKRKIIVDGTYENFKMRLDKAEETARAQVAIKATEQSRLREAIARNEQLEQQEAERKAAERAEEKKRLKEQREQERLQKAAEKAEKAVEKHNKAVESMMTNLVASIINAGGKPGRGVYQSMRDDIENDVATGAANLEEVELILEALDTLIKSDTNA